MQDEMNSKQFLFFTVLIIILCCVFSYCIWDNSYNATNTRHYTYEGKDYFIKESEYGGGGYAIIIKFDNEVISKIISSKTLYEEKIFYYKHSIFSLSLSKTKDYGKLIQYMLQEYRGGFYE